MARIERCWRIAARGVAFEMTEGMMLSERMVNGALQSVEMATLPVRDSRGRAGQPDQLQPIADAITLPRKRA